MRAFLLSAGWGGLGLLAACAAPSPTITPNPPPVHVIQSLGYNDAVQLGSVYAQELGYPNARLEDASPLGGNLWRVRFGLGAETGHGHLVLELDPNQKKLVKSLEQSGISGQYHTAPP
jgi:hypothetical protein